MTRRYNHQFQIAYSVNSDHPKGADLTPRDHRDAIIARARELMTLSVDEALNEAVENMDNSYENECLLPGGWPPEPEAADDPATTG
jgi:hypothetical protein